MMTASGLFSRVIVTGSCPSATELRTLPSFLRRSSAVTVFMQNLLYYNIGYHSRYVNSNLTAYPITVRNNDRVAAFQLSAETVHFKVGQKRVLPQANQRPQN